MIHCASLGEYEQGKVLLKLIREKNPRKKIVLTFFSASGFEVQKNNPYADFVLYLPPDTPAKTREFVRKLNPEVFIFIKYEYWKNLIDALHKHGTKIFTAFAVFKPSDAYFKPLLKNFYRKVFSRIHKILVQDAFSEKTYLEKIGLKNTKVVGDGRIDAVFENLQATENFPEIAQFTENAFTVVAGSTWEPDEKILRNILEKFPEIRLVLAPHELSKKHLNSLKKIFPEAVFWSHKNLVPTTRVLVIDTIGMLKYLYRYGDLCYIGGGFGAGIHNTLEAAVYGKALAFGPKYRKFNEAVRFVRDGIAKVIRKEQELAAWIELLQTDAKKEIEKKAKRYLEENRGASLRAYEEIFSR